jgi:hypothetical protein
MDWRGSGDRDPTRLRLNSVGQDHFGPKSHQSRSLTWSGLYAVWTAQSVFEAIFDRFLRRESTPLSVFCLGEAELAAVLAAMKPGMNEHK